LPRRTSGHIHFIPASIQPGGVPTPLPQVGTICMDQCLVDLGPAGADGNEPPPLARWSEVVVFGPQAGAENAATLARAAGTIPYEITCGISRRVPRIYQG
jgi:alanine racemase